MWTHFYDMHSGGGTKEPPYEHIFIEADRDEAVSVFYSAFSHSPERISCTCCGEDYAIYTEESLDQLTGYHRGCETADFFKDEDDEGHLQRLTKKESAETKWTRVGEDYSYVHQPSGRKVFTKYVEEKDKSRSYAKYMTLEDYLSREDVRVITAEDIEYHGYDRKAEVPQEGWTWK